MRNLIMGSIGVLLGLPVVFFTLSGGLGDDPKPGRAGDRAPAQQREGGAFKIGQIVGTVFGFLLLGVGGYYVYRGIMDVREQRAEDELLYDRPRRKKKKKSPSTTVPRTGRGRRDDDEADEDEHSPRRRPRRSHVANMGIPPLALWLGAGAAALIVLIGGGVLFYFFVFDMAPELPDSAAGAKIEMTKSFGKDRVVTLEIRGIQKEHVPSLLGRLGRLRDKADGGLQGGSRLGEGTFFIVAPVTDLAQFAEGIDFGQVKRVSRRHRHLVVEVDSSRLGDLTR